LKKHFQKAKFSFVAITTTHRQTSDGILFDIYEVTEIITPENAAGHFMHTKFF
jgi:aspartate aminotransferase-like enzyme